MALVLTDVSSGYNISSINTNFDTTETYINTSLLHRAGSVAGEATMQRDLDMNGHSILNANLDTSTITNDRALRVPGSEGSIEALPIAALRANKVLTFDSAGLPVVTVPASGSAADVLQQLALSTGAGLVGYGASTVATSLPLDVKYYGAKGDGVTDDTTAIQNAVNAAAAAKRSLFFPAGVYITGTITLPAYSNLHGEYIGQAQGTVLKARTSDGMHDILYGLNSDNLFGTTVPTNTTAYAHNIVLSNLVIDGNVTGVNTAFSPSMTGRGIAIWGGSLNFHDVDILNCGKYGIQTEYSDMDVEWAYYFREASFRNIRIRNIGQHGWYMKGPHDSKLVDVSVINAGQSTNSTYDGLYFLGQGTCDLMGVHVSTSGNQTGDSLYRRHRYAANFEASCRVSCSSFEGATYAAARIASNCQFDDACLFYAPWGDGNSATLILLATANLSVLRGKISASGGQNDNMAVFAVRFDETAPTSGIDIDVLVEGCSVPVSFGANVTTPDGDSGNNSIKIKSYYGGSRSYATFGTPNTGNATKLLIQLSGAQNYVINSRQQGKITALSAGSTFTWTYKYPFTGTPSVSLAFSPGSTPTGNVWISGIGSTAVSVYNGTGAAISLHINANEPQINT